MDPITLMMMLGLGGQAASMFGIGKTDPSYQQTNPLTDQYYADIMKQIQRTQSQQEQYNSQATGAIDRSRQAGADMQRTEGQIAGMNAPDVNAWFEDFLGQVPEYQRIAKQGAESFTEQQGRNLQEQARVQQSQSLEAAGTGFGGQAFSGAAAGAAGAAAAQPIAQAQNQLGNLQAQMAGNNFNSMTGQGMGLAQNSQQQGFSNELQQLAQLLGSQQGRAGIEQGAAQGYSGIGGQYASLLSGLRGAQADVAQPVYMPVAGTDIAGDLSQLAMGGAGLANYMKSQAVIPQDGASVMDQWSKDGVNVTGANGKASGSYGTPQQTWAPNPINQPQYAQPSYAQPGVNSFSPGAFQQAPSYSTQLPFGYQAPYGTYQNQRPFNGMNSLLNLPF